MRPNPSTPLTNAFVAFMNICLRPSILLVAALTTTSPLPAHEQVTPVIVDTDVALDDARALVLLAVAPHLELKAVVTSDGSTSPLTGAGNARRILHCLDRDNVSVGVGRELNAPPPPWRQRAEALGWADLPPGPTNPLPSAVTVIEQSLADAKAPVTYVCLGPLTNLADALRHRPAIKSHLAMVWFYGSAPGDPSPGWNVERDVTAAHAVFASGLPIVAVALPDSQLLKPDDDFLASLTEANTPAARLMESLHRDPRVRDHLRELQMRAWDDTVALLLLKPELGRFTEPTSNVRRVADFDRTRAVEFYREVIAGHEGPGLERPLVVLRAFPAAPGEFQGDVAPFVREIIARHGEGEWEIVVLTNELHRHLGLYSILGAKMGLRARELLSANLDELHVESLAGLNPPVSCLNDGLQVSTGASLGRGTITVPATDSPAAAAVFAGRGRRLRMQVKSRVIGQIQEEIRAAARQYGDLTPAYFEAVRQISLQAWRDLDRKTIFEETSGVDPNR